MSSNTIFNSGHMEIISKWFCLRFVHRNLKLFKKNQLVQNWLNLFNLVHWNWVIARPPKKWKTKINPKGCHMFEPTPRSKRDFILRPCCQHSHFSIHLQILDYGILIIRCFHLVDELEFLLILVKDHSHYGSFEQKMLEDTFVKLEFNQKKILEWSNLLYLPVGEY